MEKIEDSHLKLQDHLLAVKKVLNIIGFDLVVDSEKKEVFIKSPTTKTGKLEFVDLSMSSNKKTSTSNVLNYDAEIGNEAYVNIKYNVESSVLNLTIIGDFYGKTEISFTYNIIPARDLYTPKEAVIKTISLKMHNNKENGVDQTISYSKNSNLLSFVKTNGYLATEKAIHLSTRDNGESTVIIGTKENGSSYEITSSGDEEYYRLSQRCNLEDRSFAIRYLEHKPNGGIIYQVLTDDEKYKHYTNIKLVNNKNIRAFIDEFISEFRDRFRDSNLRSEMFKGKLFEAYYYGEPNEKASTENLLEKINFISVNKPSRRRNKKSVKSAANK